MTDVEVPTDDDGSKSAEVQLQQRYEAVGETLDGWTEWQWQVLTDVLSSCASVEKQGSETFERLRRRLRFAMSSMGVDDSTNMAPSLIRILGRSGTTAINQESAYSKLNDEAKLRVSGLRAAHGDWIGAALQSVVSGSGFDWSSLGFDKYVRLTGEDRQPFIGMDVYLVNGTTTRFEMPVGSLAYFAQFIMEELANLPEEFREDLRDGHWGAIDRCLELAGDLGKLRPSRDAESADTPNGEQSE